MPIATAYPDVISPTPSASFGFTTDPGDGAVPNNVLTWTDGNPDTRIDNDNGKGYGFDGVQSAGIDAISRWLEASRFSEFDDVPFESIINSLTMSVNVFRFSNSNQQEHKFAPAVGSDAPGTFQTVIINGTAGQPGGNPGVPLLVDRNITAISGIAGWAAGIPAIDLVRKDRLKMRWYMANRFTTAHSGRLDRFAYVADYTAPATISPAGMFDGLDKTLPYWRQALVRRCVFIENYDSNGAFGNYGWRGADDTHLHATFGLWAMDLKPMFSGSQNGQYGPGVANLGLLKCRPFGTPGYDEMQANVGGRRQGSRASMSGGDTSNLTLTGHFAGITLVPGAVVRLYSETGTSLDTGGGQFYGQNFGYCPVTSIPDANTAILDWPQASPPTARTADVQIGEFINGNELGRVTDIDQGFALLDNTETSGAVTDIGISVSGANWPVSDELTAKVVYQTHDSFSGGSFRIQFRKNAGSTLYQSASISTTQPTAVRVATFDIPADAGRTSLQGGVCCQLGEAVQGPAGFYFLYLVRKNQLTGVRRCTNFLQGGQSALDQSAAWARMTPQQRGFRIKWMCDADPTMPRMWWTNMGRNDPNEVIDSIGPDGPFVGNKMNAFRDNAKRFMLSVKEAVEWLAVNDDPRWSFTQDFFTWETSHSQAADDRPTYRQAWMRLCRAEPRCTYSHLPNVGTQAEFTSWSADGDHLLTVGFNTCRQRQFTAIFQAAQQTSQFWGIQPYAGNRNDLTSVSNLNLPGGRVSRAPIHHMRFTRSLSAPPGISTGDLHVSVTRNRGCIWSMEALLVSAADTAIFRFGEESRMLIAQLTSSNLVVSLALDLGDTGFPTFYNVSVPILRYVKLGQRFRLSVGIRKNDPNRTLVVWINGRRVGMVGAGAFDFWADTAAYQITNGPGVPIVGDALLYYKVEPMPHGDP